VGRGGLGRGARGAAGAGPAGLAGRRGLDARAGGAAAAPARPRFAVRGGGGPAAAAALAAWRGRGPGGTALPRNVRFGQGIAAGVLANGTAAIFVSALGTGTTALMLRSAWLLHWLNHGHQLTAIATYRYETNAAGGAAAYLFMLIWFPVIGLLMSAFGTACTPLGRPVPAELPPVPATPRYQ